MIVVVTDNSDSSENCISHIFQEDDIRIDPYTHSK